MIYINKIYLCLFQYTLKITKYFPFQFFSLQNSFRKPMWYSTLDRYFTSKHYFTTNQPIKNSWSIHKQHLFVLPQFDLHSCLKINSSSLILLIPCLIIFLKNFIVNNYVIKYNLITLLIIFWFSIRIRQSNHG